jgi:hypothetical protein
MALRGFFWPAYSAARLRWAMLLWGFLASVSVHSRSFDSQTVLRANARTARHATTPTPSVRSHVGRRRERPATRATDAAIPTTGRYM